MASVPAHLGVIVSGPLDDLRSPLVRFLQEAARGGPMHVYPWSDQAIGEIEGRQARFPAPERQYFLEALRFVSSTEMTEDDPPGPHALPAQAVAQGGTWVLPQAEDHPEKRAFCLKNNLGYRVLPEQALSGFPLEALPFPTSRMRPHVIVTGSFDWLHTGHVRFFEEVSAYGDLTVVVGHDANIELLKGPGHPLFKQEERLYMVHAIRYVSQALLSTGNGWLDAEPELQRLKPDIYAVNEDGDKPEKSEYCQAHSIEYLVLKRAPKTGLNARSSTDLRGF
jgi:cytidyltransferase-like protein